MSSAGITLVALPMVIGAERRGDTLVLTASQTLEARVLLWCDHCDEVAAAGIDEAAARLNLLEDGGIVVEGLDLCGPCRRGQA